MAHLTIDLPDEMAGYLQQQISEGRGATPSEIVTRMLRRQRERESLEAKVLAADMANAANAVTPEFFDSLRESVRQRQPVLRRGEPT